MESQTPGSKPPAPQQPAPTEQPWISPRLRDKLGDAEPGAPKEGPAPWVGIVLVLLVIGGGAGLFVTMRSGAERQKADAERIARERAAAAAAESTANTAKIDSMRAVAAARATADSAAGIGKPAGQASAPAKPATAGGATGGSARAAATPPAGGDAAPATPKVVEKGPFGLDVGTFLAQERASSELARLSTATGLNGKVVTRNEDGGDVYHVVLGSFATRAAADKRAESLVARSLVNQAQSVKLAP